MLNIKSLLEITKENRLYQLVLPNDCPLGEVHDVLCAMKQYILNMMNDQHQQDIQEIRHEQHEQPESEV